ncbi:hypothetical protein [Deinococcus aquaticus]|uniref:hypothetical protein n=1 Tax=Deinococcus aquaticus TaxID=328692 RepID=UPI003F44BFCB
MKRLLLTLILSTTTASAQLQVTVPPVQSCPEGSTPVIGISVENYFDGDYGFEASGALEKALEKAGFTVVSEFDYQLIDKASVLVVGSVDHWSNAFGGQSTRVGAAYLQVKDLSTGQVLMNLEQKAAWTVIQAPTFDSFTKDALTAISARFCQKRPGA